MTDELVVHKKKGKRGKRGRKILTLSQVKSSHLYLYSAFNNTNCDKATAQYQNGKIVSKCKMTRLNTQFSVKGISLLNPVMASSSSIQFKKFLFNQVDDIAGN